jgi:predicted esterase
MEEWTKVGSAPNETSALMMQGILENASIPALIQRGAGFDVPDFLSAGPRDVLVPESALEEARQILEDTTGLGSWVS